MTYIFGVGRERAMHSPRCVMKRKQQEFFSASWEEGSASKKGCRMEVWLNLARRLPLSRMNALVRRYIKSPELNAKVYLMGPAPICKPR